MKIHELLTKDNWVNYAGCGDKLCAIQWIANVYPDSISLMTIKFQKSNCFKQWDDIHRWNDKQVSVDPVIRAFQRADM